MDLSPEARRLLELAHEARTPTGRDKARVARRLALVLGVSASAASSVAIAQATATSAASIKSTSALVLWKWALAGSALLSVALGGYVAWSAQPIAAPSDSRVREQSTQIAAPPYAPVTSVQPEPVEPVANAPETSAARASARQRGVVKSENGGLAAELALLHDAQRAWRATDASRALALLEEHRRRFPRSLLRLERDALLVLTLCELGRVEPARRLAQRVLARAPGAPMRTSIEASCAFK